MINFIITRLFALLLTWCGQYALGTLVFRNKLRVNYSRKIGTFAFFYIPILFNRFFPYDKTLWMSLMSYALPLASLALYTVPVRSRVPFIKRAFLQFDRPEDRPYTLLWLVTQLVATWAAIYVPLLLLPVIGIPSTWEIITGIAVVLTPLVMIGDGLAEPVGVRFGKHRYRTFALFTSRRYYRTFEGSAAVFVSSILILLFFHPLFSTPELITALAIVPLLLTITEAVSPHTWDQPFLMMTGATALTTIMHFI